MQNQVIKKCLSSDQFWRILSKNYVHWRFFLYGPQNGKFYKKIVKMPSTNHFPPFQSHKKNFSKFTLLIEKQTLDPFQKFQYGYFNIPY